MELSFWKYYFYVYQIGGKTGPGMQMALFMTSNPHTMTFYCKNKLRFLWTKKNWVNHPSRRWIKIVNRTYRPHLKNPHRLLLLPTKKWSLIAYLSLSLSRKNQWREYWLNTSTLWLRFQTYFHLPCLKILSLGKSGESSRHTWTNSKQWMNRVTWLLLRWSNQVIKTNKYYRLFKETQISLRNW